MIYERLPYESLRNSIYEGFDSTHGTNVDDPGSTLLFYYDLKKVNRFERQTNVSVFFMGLTMSMMTPAFATSTSLSFRLFFIGMMIATFCLHCLLQNVLWKDDYRLRMALPGLSVRPDGLTVVGSRLSVTAPQTIPWNAISKVTASKKFSGCTVIEIFVHDSEEARMSIQKMGTLSYSDYSIVQKFLSNILPDTKRVAIFGDQLYVDPHDVVKIINERAAYYREQRKAS